MNAEQYRALVRKLEAINEDPAGTPPAPPGQQMDPSMPFYPSMPAAQPAAPISPDKVWAQLKFEDKAMIMKILQEPNNQLPNSPAANALIAQANTMGYPASSATHMSAGAGSVRGRGNQGQGGPV